MEILRLLEALKRRKTLFFVVFGVFFAVVLLITHLCKPVYQARAKVYIQTQNDPLQTIFSSLGLKSSTATSPTTTSSSSSTSDIFNTDIELAKIKPLLDKLIQELNLKARNGSTIKPDKLLKSGLLTRKTIRPQPYIDIDQYEDGDMLQFTAYSTNLTESVNMANRLSELYIISKKERIQQDYREARQLVSNEIQKARAEYYGLLDTVIDFKEREKIVDADKQIDKLLDNISQAQNNYNENEKSIVELGAKAEEGKKKLKDIEVMRKGSQQYSRSSAIDTLQSNLYDAMVSITSKTLDITKEHPDYKSLENKIDTIKEIFKKEAGLVFNNEQYTIDPEYDELTKAIISNTIDKETAIVKRNILKYYIDKYQNELRGVPRKVAELSKLQTPVSSIQDVYTKLLSFSYQAAVAENISLSNIHLVEAAYAYTDDPYFPNKPLNYALGFLLAIFWGLSSVILAEYVDNTVRKADDIKDILSLPILGTIAKTRFLCSTNTISGLNPSSPIIDSYRKIKNTLNFTAADKSRKVISIVGSLENEGTSSTASNIAVIYTMVELKVLLIDLNLRKPSIHKFFKLSMNKGIGNVISENMDIEKAIIKTNIANLEILPAGSSLPDDPYRIIESLRMKEIIEKMKGLYDMVIIDTPPLLSFDDAIVIGSFVDGIIYVIEPGRLNIHTIKNTLERVTKAGLNLIGIVVNKAQT